MSYVPTLDHYIHPSQSHATTRHWQAQGNCNFSPKDFVYPVFVLNDDSKSESVDSFPGNK